MTRDSLPRGGESQSVSSCSVMDGMTEACVKGGIEACYASVSCACALLVALDELSQGRGIQPEQVVPLKGQFTLRKEKMFFRNR